MLWQACDRETNTLSLGLRVFFRFSGFQVHRSTWNAQTKCRMSGWRGLGGAHFRRYLLLFSKILLYTTGGSIGGGAGRILAGDIASYISDLLL